MKYLILISVLLFTGCTNASDKQVVVQQSTHCEISFNALGPCSFNGVRVKLISEKIAKDEKGIVRLDVQHQGVSLSVKPADRISMLDGDKGYIDFSDINFDGVADLAITSSFGLANLYLEYWVFDNAARQYVYIGNHAVFEIDSENKALKNQIRVNAATYESSIFNWKGKALVKVR